MSKEQVLHIVIAFLAFNLIILVTNLLKLRSQLKFSDACIKHRDVLLEVQYERLKEGTQRINHLTELLEVYRKISNRLVSVHVSDTFLHFKVSKGFLVQDRDKAIDEIVSLLKDKLP